MGWEGAFWQYGAENRMRWYRKIYGNSERGLHMNLNQDGSGVGPFAEACAENGTDADARAEVCAVTRSEPFAERYAVIRAELCAVSHADSGAELHAVVCAEGFTENGRDAEPFAEEMQRMG
jgi:hypothetical protein